MDKKEKTTVVCVRAYHVSGRITDHSFILPVSYSLFIQQHNQYYTLVYTSGNHVLVEHLISRVDEEIENLAWNVIITNNPLDILKGLQWMRAKIGIKPTE